MKITKSLLIQLVETVNECTAFSLVLDYQSCYGGYSLFDAEDAKKQLRFPSTHGRLSALNMYYYLSGLLNAAN